MIIDLILLQMVMARFFCYWIFGLLVIDCSLLESVEMVVDSLLSRCV